MNKNTLPYGWFAAGSSPQDYEIGRDQNEFFKGTYSGRVKSKCGVFPSGFGTLMQGFSAKQYEGKRLCMSAYVKSCDVEGWAGLWMRVDGAVQDRILAFDNMQDRPIKGSTDWKEHQVVLDIIETSYVIAFGLILSGVGCVWVDQFKFQVVDKTVPTTPFYRDAPLNLSFDE